MNQSGEGQVTELLAQVGLGDDAALGALFSLVYSELRILARGQLAGHRKGTLSTTAVVHEAYLKLLGSQQLRLEDRRHFFALAARAMRQILTDHARLHLAKKRGGGMLQVSGAADLKVSDRAAELLDLDTALERLSGVDERLGTIVDLRFFAGLSVDETAELLEVSPRTVKRDWRRARAFLYHEVQFDRTQAVMG